MYVVQDRLHQGKQISHIFVSLYRLLLLPTAVTDKKTFQNVTLYVIKTQLPVLAIGWCNVHREPCETCAPLKQLAGKPQFFNVRLS